MSTYIIEPSKSNRSTCRGKCRSKIAKGALRIGIKDEIRGDQRVTLWYHIGCFPFPRHLKQDGVTEEDFVHEHLTDTSPDGSVLPDKDQEVIEGLQDRAPRSPSPEAKEGEDNLKRLAKHHAGDSSNSDNEKLPAAKRSKDDGSAMAQAYNKYKEMQVKDLKEILKWNKQAQTGNRTQVLNKVLDGHVHGRMARCNLCGGGNLILHDDGKTVTCAGVYDPLRHSRLPCRYEGSTEDCPRWQPWYTQEPTPEQDAEMTRMIEEAVGAAKPVSENDPAVRALSDQAKDKSANLQTDKGIQSATNQIYDLLQSCDKPLDLPSDKKRAKQVIGSTIASHRNLSLADMVPVLAKEFGFQQDKEAIIAKKRQAQKSHLKCPDNAPIVGAFQELGDLYAQQGRRREASIYAKATEALSKLDYKVTSENAMSLGSRKSKSKVDGIGEKTAHYIEEFCRTGKIGKLEQKEADVKG